MTAILDNYIFIVYCSDILSMFSQAIILYAVQLNINSESLKSGLKPLEQQHPFNGTFSGTTQVSWYQEGKT